jgi:hypothetical protein
MRVLRLPWKSALLFLLLTVAFGTASRATTAIPMTEAQMTQKADWIGIGEVQRTRAEWIGRRLWTFVDVTVSETLKGTPERTVTVVLPGGTDSARNLRMIVPGVTTTMPKGARMLLMGVRTELVAGGLQPVGMMQGMFLFPAESTAAKPAGSLSRVQIGGSGEIQPVGGASEQLRALRGRIAALLDGTSPAGAPSPELTRSGTARSAIIREETR